MGEVGLQRAVVVDAVRTPGGRRGGLLSSWHPVDLAAEVLQAVVTRNHLDPAWVDDVMLGCVMQVGEQSLNVARNAVLAAGWPESVPGVTIDRQCGSSQQAVHFALQGVAAGTYEIVVAGGVESMTRTPLGSSVVPSLGLPFGPRVFERYADQGGLVAQGISAELIAERYGIEREELDAYALRSHRRAATATDEGRFSRELVVLPGRDGQVLTSDEGIRRDTSLEALAALKPAFKPEGRITAGNSSQITDGASAVLVMSEERANALGLTPRARAVATAVVGVDPLTMLLGPIPATRAVLERAKLELTDMDLVEVNEAFASVVLAFQRELHCEEGKLNVNGGAIALGHPLGATGGKLIATLLSELERTGGRYGLLAMCEGGGMANATVFERIS